MEFRTYDPAIGRFNGIDPVTHFSQGTSVAFDNNPVFWADPSGADGISSVTDMQNLAGSSGSGDFYQRGNNSNGGKPKGAWTPKVEDDGSVSYVASNGSSAETLAKQYTIGNDLSEDEQLVIAEKITGTKGNENIKSGTVVSGQSVIDQTDSPILKFDLGSELHTSQTFFDHFMFVRDFSSSGKAFLTSTYFDISNYYKSSERGTAYIVLDGKSIKVSFNIPIFRTASWDKYDKSWAYVTHAHSRTTGWSKYFDDRTHVRLEQYHPSGNSQNGFINIGVHINNGEALQKRMERTVPRYNYLSLKQKNKN